MTCGAINPGSPYLWLTLGGIFLGGGLSFLLVPRRRRKPAVSAVLLSIFILAVLAALFVSDFSLDNLRFRLLWLSGSAVLGFAGFLFWKALGIPLFFVVILFISLCWYSFQGISCAFPETEICSFSTISEGSGFVRIRYESVSGVSGIDRIDGDRIYPLLEIIEAPEFFFILRTGRLYSFSGFSSSGEVSEPVSESPFMKQILRIPGFSRSFYDLEPVKVSPSIDYSLVFNEERKVKVIRRIE